MEERMPVKDFLAQGFLFVDRDQIISTKVVQVDIDVFNIWCANSKKDRADWFVISAKALEQKPKRLISYQ